MAYPSIDQLRPVPQIGARTRSVQPQHENEIPVRISLASTQPNIKVGQAVKLVTSLDPNQSTPTGYTTVDLAMPGDTMYAILLSNSLKTLYLPGMVASAVNGNAELWYQATGDITSGDTVGPDYDNYGFVKSSSTNIMGRAVQSALNQGFLAVEIDLKLAPAGGSLTPTKVQAMISESTGYFPITSNYTVTDTDPKRNFQMVGGAPDPAISLILTSLTLSPAPNPVLTFEVSNDSAKDGSIVTSTGTFSLSSGSTGSIQYDSTKGVWEFKQL